MKPNSSWSLRQNENAPNAPKNVGGAGSPAGGGGKDSAPLLERRICWFIAKSAEKRATVADLTAGLGLTAEETKAMTKSMVRKGILRELLKSAERPQSQFAITPRYLHEAASMASGPDPATL